MYALTTHQLQVERRESYRANQVYALQHQLQVERRGVIEPIKCMRSPHTSYRWRERGHRANQVDALATHSYRWRGERVIEPIKCMRRHTPATVERRESHRANQVDALATHQLQVERRESHRANQVYAFTTHQLRWRGERVIEPIKCMLSTHPATGGEEGES